MIQFSISLSGQEFVSVLVPVLGFAVGVLIYKMFDRWMQ